MTCDCKRVLRGCLALAAAVLLFSAGSAQALSLQIGSELGASLRFDGAGPGGTFQFINNGDGFGFWVESSDEDLLGFGRIEGLYSIGPITSLGGGVESASVSLLSGSAKLVLDDQNGGILEAALTWDEITTSGTGGNLSAYLSLSGLSYNGTHADLLALDAADDGAIAVAFHFQPPKSLTQLTADDATGVNANSSDSFSGTIRSVPDGGSTVVLLGMALTALGAWSSRRKQQ